MSYTEVGKAAYELLLTHGRKAYAHATKLAKSARSEGNADEQKFWKAVAELLQPISD